MLMERKLAEYRAKKAKECKNQAYENPSHENEKNDAAAQENLTQDSRIWSKSSQFLQSNEVGRIATLFQKLYTVNGILKVALWFTLWMFFLQIEFGAVYFAVSLTLILYYSMKYDQRKYDELSAYSVFNKNCERLEGTFTAEQFDNQIRRGGGLH